MTTTTLQPKSANTNPGRVTLQTLREKKQRHEPITTLTAYDYSTAKLLAAAGLDILLVGDTAAMTMLGAESTVTATLDFLVTLTAAVRRGRAAAFVMADMPFATYPDVPTAAANAARFVREAGADAVKFEMDGRHVEMVEALAAAGIVVCACGVAAATRRPAGRICGPGADAGRGQADCGDGGGVGGGGGRSCG